jgi:hypothetical protein
MAGEAGKQSPEQAKLKEDRTKLQRHFFMNVLLMFLVAIVVFVIGTYFFVIPLMIRAEMRVTSSEKAIANLNSAVEQILDDEKQEAIEKEAAEAAAAPAKADAAPAPAVVPAPAQPKAPPSKAKPPAAKK